jgi:sugar (pentulose or hexulose) kinase
MIIGLDIGTTTVTGVAWDDGAGRVLQVARRRNDAALPAAQATRAEEAPRRLLGLSLEVLAELAAGNVPPPSGIALTGQKHGLLCVDVRGEPLTPLISWQDQRTAEPVAQPPGMTTLELVRRRLAGLDWRANGCRLQHGYGAATLFWLLRYGGLPAAAERACTAAGWVAAQFCGAQPATDPTFAASWGIYDLLHGTWNDAFLEALDLPARLLPPLRPAGEALGGLAPAMARAAGLPAGLPVFNAVGDTQASFLGSVPLVEGSVLVNLGTGGQVCWALPTFEPPSERVETRPLPESGVLRVGASLCGGAAYAWLNRTLRACLAEFGLDLDEETVYRRLNALAAAGAGSGGLRVRTTFLGVRGDPSVEGGAIVGITEGNMTPGALARATLTGLVDELHDLYAGAAGPAGAVVRLVAAGGAVEQNPLLLEILGQRFALPVQPAAHREAAAVGAASLAARR